ncbi:peptidoglycan-associated lipoprotein Pal [Thiorhodococcus mannitoliphagus]|uniref:Peptidoglycan-associated lipoprotein n=1 Tax=Thiorhodococcus mannitoliphagus TaxID=329406 RepID=A0A6P1DMU0_9GAMM|nr:peptidoglycan-associated lipoprotein Pal [Thiorhodococcus mannitoliphagus]NEX19577.1 peptidoglycan-associated lipoprotein Pal [Thiorhodococcus mannitoliphagus]
MHGSSRFLLLCLALIGLGGCATAPPPPLPEPMAENTAPLPTRTVPEVSTAPVETTRPTYAGPWEDPSNPLYERTIYFDYDSAEIKPEYVTLMRTHARYLGSHTDTRVTLEGHTDERGTREYNLALADQRGESVRRFMLAEGVLPDQMATLSYGEERPVELGHNEQSWRRNRRVIIQY